MIHIAEEYVVGGGLPLWFSTHFNAGLSSREFLVINGFGMLLIVGSCVINAIRKSSDSLLVALYTLIFVNGAVHLFASLVTLTYSPGVISGTFIYIPLSVSFFRTVVPDIPTRIKRLGILTGITIHILVTIIALNI